MYELVINITGHDIVGTVGKSYVHAEREDAYADLGKRFANAMMKAQGNPVLKVELLDPMEVAGFKSTLAADGSWLTIEYAIYAI